jgi:hypothetical protein
MATYITKTQVSATDRKKFTFSAWIKRSKLSSGSQNIYESFYDASNRITFWINSSDQLRVWYPSSGSTYAELNSSQLLRDCNAWYHVVLTVDSTESTQADRVKVYLNGSRITAWGTNTVNVPLNGANDIGTTGYKHNISRYGTGSGDTFFGLMSHIHLTDGYAYDASAFGSTDSTTGEWKINTSPSVTYGNNGFFILKDGNSTTDHSGNSASFTTSGTLTKTEDCPSNVFATFNPLATFANITLTNGNNTYTLNAGTWESTPSTLAVPSSGKYYAEFKWNASSTTAQYIKVGVDAPRLFTHWGTQYPGNSAVGYAYGWDGDKRNNGSNTSYGDAWSATSIIGVAIDMDNKKLYFHKDGVYQNSGVPTSGSTGTGALSLTEDEYYLIVSGYKNTENPSIHANFGNGYFGTTAVATQGTNASGNGIFEFDVPTGYTALSTKGLNL